MRPIPGSKQVMKVDSYAELNAIRLAMRDDELLGIDPGYRWASYYQGVECLEFVVQDPKPPHSAGGSR